MTVATSATTKSTTTATIGKRANVDQLFAEQKTKKQEEEQKHVEVEEQHVEVEEEDSGCDSDSFWL